MINDFVTRFAMPSVTTRPVRPAIGHDGGGRIEGEAGRKDRQAT